MTNPNPSLVLRMIEFSTKIAFNYFVLIAFSLIVQPNLVNSCRARDVASPRSQRTRCLAFRSVRVAKRLYPLGPGQAGPPGRPRPGSPFPFSRRRGPLSPGL